MKDTIKIDEKDLPVLKYISEQMSNNKNKPIKYVYVELRYIQDIIIGALMLLYKEEAFYNYMIANMDKYNNRIQDDLNKLFPDVKIDTAEVTKFINDPQNSDSLYLLSPHTSVCEFLSDHHNECLRYNNITTDYNDKITYVINTYPLTLSSKMLVLLKTRLYAILGHEIKIAIMNIDSKKITENNIELFDRLFVYDLDTFLHETGIPHNLFNTKYLPDKIIYTPRRLYRDEYNAHIVDNIQNYSKEQIEHLFNLTASTINIVVDLLYLDPIIEIRE